MYTGRLSPEHARLAHGAESGQPAFVAGGGQIADRRMTSLVEVTGCDLFTFRNGKIAIKNSFRTNRPPIGQHVIAV
jgi:hypothetical protein